MMDGVFRGFVALLVGVLLVCFNQEVIPLLIRLIGVAFFLPSFLALVRVYLGKGRGVSSSFAVALTTMLDVLRLVFGLWLIFSPVTFASVFVLLAASVLLLFSFLQIAVAVSAMKYLPWRFGMLVVPVLLLVVSFVVLLNPFEAITTASFVVGVCAIVSGLFDILISLFVKRYKKRQEKKVDITEE